MEKFRKTRESKREERKEEESVAGQNRQTRMEDFFRVTRTRSLVRTTILILFLTENVSFVMKTFSTRCVRSVIFYSHLPFQDPVCKTK